MITDVLSRIGQLRTQLGLPQVTATDATSSAATSAASGADAATGANGSAGTTGAADFASAMQLALGQLSGSGGTGTTGADVVADARRYLGVPYVFGGTNPSTGLDCSGLVQRVYGDLGVNLPRTAAQQAKVGTAVTGGIANAKPGDLLAFNSPVSHIAIYIGNGQMIAAPKAGDVVKVQQVYKTPTAIRRIVAQSGSAATAATGTAVATSVLPATLRTASAAPAQRTTTTTGASGSVPYADLFAAATERYGLPKNLLAAVAKVESGYDPKAVSSAGARGLMQIMPATARGLGVDPMDPAQAVDGAARILSADLKTFGSLPLALAAYNAGSGAVRKYGGIPPYSETMAYVPKVQAALASLNAKGLG